MIRSGAILFLRIKKEIVSESLLPRRGRDYRTRVEKHPIRVSDARGKKTVALKRDGAEVRR